MNKCGDCWWHPGGFPGKPKKINMIMNVAVMDKQEVVGRGQCGYRNQCSSFVTQMLCRMQRELWGNLWGSLVTEELSGQLPWNCMGGGGGGEGMEKENIWLDGFWPNKCFTEVELCVLLFKASCYTCSPQQEVKSLFQEEYWMLATWWPHKTREGEGLKELFLLL